MSRAGDIRRYLRENGPSLTRVIACALGLTGNDVCMSLCEMMKGDIVRRTGVRTAYLYELVRDVPDRVPMTADERLKLERERNRVRHRQRGGKTREQYNAEMAAKRTASQKRRREEAARIRQMAARLKAERMATQEHAAKERSDKALAVRRKSDNSLASSRPVVIMGETVEEYMARGGQIEVLPPFAYSTPLRFDHDNARGME